MTNYERLQQMDENDLARELCDMSSCDICPGRHECNREDGHANGLKKWMRKEAEEE